MAGYSDYRDRIVNEFIATLMDGIARHVNSIALCTGETLGMTYDEIILPYQGSNRNERRTEWQYQNAWAAAELKEHGMVENPERGCYRITDLGLMLLGSGEDITIKSMKEFSRKYSGNQRE